MKFGNYVNESSLSRLWKHNQKHDCGAITAFRTARNCGEGEKFTKKEKLQRNKSLTAKLVSKGYDITRLHGKYPEGDKKTTEISYFVVDSEDKGDLEKNLKYLGEEFEQDSILFIPKGSIDNKSTAYLIGTNRCENNWLGYGKKKSFKKSQLGYNSEIYTSYVNGRPFIFEEIDKEIVGPGNGFGWWALHLIAKENWWEIEI